MLFYVVLGFLALLALFYRYTTREFGFFASRGVAELPGSFPFGSKYVSAMFNGSENFFTVITRMYEEMRHEKFFGYYSLGQKYVVVNDLELLKHVLVKDFDHFMDRRSFVPESEEAHMGFANKIFMQMLVSLKGEKWKGMRGILSPVFTSGKLRNMAPLLNRVGDDLVAHLKEYCETSKDFKAKDVMAQYTADAIGTCGFGIEANSFEEPEGEFMTMVSDFDLDFQMTYLQSRRGTRI